MSNWNSTQSCKLTDVKGVSKIKKSIVWVNYHLLPLISRHLVLLYQVSQKKCAFKITLFANGYFFLDIVECSNLHMQVNNDFIDKKQLLKLLRVDNIK